MIFLRLLNQIKCSILNKSDIMSKQISLQNLKYALVGTTPSSIFLCSTWVFTDLTSVKIFAASIFNFLDYSKKPLQLKRNEIMWATKPDLLCHMCVHTTHNMFETFTFLLICIGLGIHFRRSSNFWKFIMIGCKITKLKGYVKFWFCIN